MDYLAAVICYYRKQYDNALLHLKQAEKLHGLDYGTASLKGHCLLATGCSRQALIAYLLVLESYNRPDDIHMVYVNASIIYESVKNFQEARKLMLLACKYSPTPYTWLTAGLLYYKVGIITREVSYLIYLATKRKFYCNNYKNYNKML